MIKELLSKHMEAWVHNDNTPTPQHVDSVSVLFELLLAETQAVDRHKTVSYLESIIADCNARIKTLNQDTLAELQLGLDVPGFKLKQGSERRAWRDGAIDTLKEHLEPADLYDMKLKGIPAVEKLLGKNGLKPAARTALLESIIDVSVGTQSLVKEK